MKRYGPVWLFLFGISPTLFSAEPVFLHDLIGYPVGKATIDAPQIVEFTDVTPPNQRKNETDRIIQLIIQPSVTITKSKGATTGLSGKHVGVEFTVTEVQYKVQTNHPVADFLPSTKLVSAIDGSITVTQQVANAEGQLRASYVFTPSSGKAAAIATGKFSDAHLAYKLLPSHDLLVSSGHINSGRGVAFSFKQTRQSSLLGRKLVTLLVKVPSRLTADYITIQATAEIQIDVEGYGGGSLGDRVAGRNKVPVDIEFDIGIHPAGDKGGLSAVRNFLEEARKPVSEEELNSKIASVTRAKAALAAAKNRRGIIDRLLGRRKPGRELYAAIRRAEDALKGARMRNRNAARETLRKMASTGKK